jgi:hypothetical protein
MAFDKIQTRSVEKQLRDAECNSTYHDKKDNFNFSDNALFSFSCPLFYFRSCIFLILPNVKVQWPSSHSGCLDLPISTPQSRYTDCCRAILRSYRQFPRWHLKVTAVLIHIISTLLLILPRTIYGVNQWKHRQMNQTSKSVLIFFLRLCNYACHTVASVEALQRFRRCSWAFSSCEIRRGFIGQLVSDFSNEQGCLCNPFMIFFFVFVSLLPTSHCIHFFYFVCARIYAFRIWKWFLESLMLWCSTLSGIFTYLRALRTSPSGDDETTVLVLSDLFEMTGKRTVLVQ